MRRRRKRRPEVGRDFIWEGGRFVFTREYLLSLEQCCGHDCPNCPYKLQNEPADASGRQRRPMHTQT